MISRENAAWRGLLIGLLFLLAGCGDTFRPTAIPFPKPGGDPQSQRNAIVVAHNNGGAGSTTHIDVSGDTKVAVVPDGAGPVQAAFSSTGVRTYVANNAGDTVSVYTTFFPLGASPVTITLPAGSHPVFLHSRISTAMYVALSGSASVGVLSTLDTFTGQIPVGTNPVALVGTPDGKKLYCLNQGSGTLTVIATPDNLVTGTISVGTSPSAMAMNPEGTTIFVANQGSNNVSVVDVGTDAVTATVGAGSAPDSIFYDPRLKRAYVANSGSSDVTVLKADISPPTVLATVAVGAALTPSPCDPTNPPCLPNSRVTALADGSRAYVANSGAGTVSVISTLSNTVSKTIAVGTTPVSIAAAGDSSKVYVANRSSNNISVIRTSDDTVVTTMASGSPEPVFVLPTP